MLAARWLCVTEPIKMQKSVWEENPGHGIAGHKMARLSHAWGGVFLSGRLWLEKAKSAWGAVQRPLWAASVSETRIHLHKPICCSYIHRLRKQAWNVDWKAGYRASCSLPVTPGARRGHTLAVAATSPSSPVFSWSYPIYPIRQLCPTQTFPERPRPSVKFLEALRGDRKQQRPVSLVSTQLSHQAE